MRVNRVLWADIAKFLAITTMVAGHLGLPSFLSTAVHMFHMPIFFVLSGLFYSHEKYQKFSKLLIARFKSLLVPYLAWGILSYVVLRLIPFAASGANSVTIKRFLLILFTHDANESSFGAIQWFFTALFFSELFMWFFVRISEFVSGSYRSLYWGLLLCTIFVVNIYVCRYIEPNYLGLKSSILGTFFLLVGYVLKDKINRILNERTRAQFFSFLGCLAVFVAVFFLNGSVNMRTTKFGNSLLFILGALSGSLIVFIISKEIEIHLSNGLLKKYILYLGRNTALILCTNRLVQLTLILLINLLISNSMNIESGVGLYIKQVVDFVIEMLLFIPLIYLVNRWIPFTMGKPMKIKTKGNDNEQ